MKTTTYKNYLLMVLLVILAFNYVDRLALGLVLQNIKADLHLSDTQLGVLSGLAFAVFYSVMGIPIARWADRGNRVVIISITTALWSAAVALCGLAGSFWQFAAISVGVAVGEAGCIPPAHSLIADYFTRAERARALSVYSLGGPLSMLIGYFLAGWLTEMYGWRVMFMMIRVGIVGVAWFARASSVGNNQDSAGAADYRASLFDTFEKCDVLPFVTLLFRRAVFHLWNYAMATDVLHAQLRSEKRSTGYLVCAPLWGRRFLGNVCGRCVGNPLCGP
jgi:MFS family permease